MVNITQIYNEKAFHVELMPFGLSEGSPKAKEKMCLNKCESMPEAKPRAIQLQLLSRLFGAPHNV